MATLVYSDVDGGERLLSLGADPITVGRATECEIRSDDPRVSRVHAKFFFDHGTLWVEDLGSANGVYVGLERVEKAPVPTGELVLIGSLMIRLLSASGTLPPPHGVHGTLAVWLESERKARAAVETERDAFGKRVNELYDEARQLRDVLSVRGTEVAKLQAQLDQLHRSGVGGTPASLQPQQSTTGQIAAVTAPIATAERGALTAQIRAQGSERTLASLREAATKAEAKSVELERRVGEVEQQRAQLKAELAAQIEKTVALETRLSSESADSALQTTEARAAKLATELAEIQLQFETQRARAAELSGLFADAEKAAKAAQAREQTAQAQLAEAHQQLQTANATHARQLKAAEAKAAEFEARLRSFEGAEAELVAAQKSRDDAREMVAGAEEQVAAAIARADEYKSRATAAEVMAKAMAKDVAEALRRAAEIDMKLRGDARELEDAQRRVEAAEQREATSATNARQFEERAIAAEIQSTQLQKELADKVAALEAEFGERSKSALLGVEAELERVRKELEAQLQASAADRDQRLTLERQITTLEQQIRELESAAPVASAAPPPQSESDQQIATLQSQLAAAKAAAKSAVKTAAALEKRIQKGETELLVSNDARAALAAELATLRDKSATGGGDSRVDELEAQLAVAEQRAADAAAHAHDLESRSKGLVERAAHAEQRASALQEQLAEMASRPRPSEARKPSEHADLERELAQAQKRIAELNREVDAAENVRQFAATTEREIAQLQRDLREQKVAVTQLTLERDRMAAQLADMQSDSVTTDRRAKASDQADQADLSRYTALVARAAELESKLARMEADNAALKLKLARAEDMIAAHDHDNETTSIASVPTDELADCLITLGESIDSLRANMRAACDETAVMEQNESVAVVSAAVSHAAEHIERARDALRILNKLFPAP